MDRSTMTSRQRVIAAIELKSPDGIPYMHAVFPGALKDFPRLSTKSTSSVLAKLLLHLSAHSGTERGRVGTWRSGRVAPGSNPRVADLLPESHLPKVKRRHNRLPPLWAANVGRIFCSSASPLPALLTIRASFAPHGRRRRTRLPGCRPTPARRSASRGRPAAEQPRPHHGARNARSAIAVGTDSGHLLCIKPWQSARTMPQAARR